MIPDGTYTAVVDRVEDGLATLEVAVDETLSELIVEPAELPCEARHADAVLTVEIEEETLIAVTYHPDESDARAQDAQDRFDRLSRRPPDSDNRD